MTETAVTICDAGPVIHLDELACLDLLQKLGRFLIPESVWAEIQRHRSALKIQQISGVEIVPVTAKPPALEKILAFQLDAGETDCLALIQPYGARLFLTDDLEARLAAEILGVRAQGTLGLLLRGARHGWRSREQIRFILETLPQHSTLHTTTRLRLEALDALHRLPT
jgi:predicted nucleic acid-binding protein